MQIYVYLNVFLISLLKQNNVNQSPIDNKIMGKHYDILKANKTLWDWTSCNNQKLPPNPTESPGLMLISQKLADTQNFQKLTMNITQLSNCPSLDPHSSG